ncbi:MAG: radical SAM protein [Nitrospinae bacterium]|nr:radical SAM protein [Nitrospinota bacterium]
MIELKPKILLMGMPGADDSPWKMNIAQAPQGPVLKKQLPLPGVIRNWINKRLQYVFNAPSRAPYVGLNLIKQNLKEYCDFDQIDYPKTDREILQIVGKIRYDVVAISIGCENRAHQAQNLALEIKKVSVNRNIKIVFGNYGAMTGKTMGILTSEAGEVLWNSKKSREDKKNDEEPYTGEGVHDMRLWLRRNFPNPELQRVNPNAPRISLPIQEEDLLPENEILRYLTKKIGAAAMPFYLLRLAVAIGCNNNCNFCNTSRAFGGEKIPLLSTGKEVFSAMMHFIEETERKGTNEIPEYAFYLLDENFSKPIEEKTDSIREPAKIFEDLCTEIEKSDINIRWATFGDLGGLFAFKNKHGDFKKLVRGGLISIWIGIESVADVYKKRGKAGIEDVTDIVHELQDLGIAVVGSFQVGLPIHTEGETVKNSAGVYEKLNIWEDINYWIRIIRPAFRQVFTISTTALIDPKKHEPMIQNMEDKDIGHTAYHNESDIPNKRVEEIDRLARTQFFHEMGPASLQSLMTIWKGFKNLENSENEADQRAATFYYWMVKRNLHLMSLSIIYFSDKFFEQCSDKFLSEFAAFLEEVPKYDHPIGNSNIHELNRKYCLAFKNYDYKIWNVSKKLASFLRRKFIEKHSKKTLFL